MLLGLLIILKDQVKVLIVMEKLEMLKDVMDNEIDDMQRLAQEHPNADFLADIEASEL